MHTKRRRVVVFGIEVGGRWWNEASNVIRMLANATARSSFPSLQAVTASALVSLLTPPPHPLLQACCLKIFIPTTTWNEVFHPLGRLLSPTCASRVCKSPTSPVAEGLAYLESGKYKHSVCLEVAIFCEILVVHFLEYRFFLRPRCYIRVACGRGGWLDLAWLLFPIGVLQLWPCCRQHAIQLFLADITLQNSG